MKASSKFFIGVDVSKDDFTSGRSTNLEDWVVQKFENQSDGIQDFIDSIKEPENTHVVLEATGNYSMKLTFALCEAGIAVSVLNPKQSKGFIQGVLLSVTKTDERDACALALYGYNNKPKSYQLPSDKLLKVRQLRTFLKQCKKQKGAICSQLHALDFHVQPLDFVRQALQQSLELCREHIAKTEKQINRAAEQCFEQAYKLATSAVGIGPATAKAILAATNALQDFENYKQLAKFIGVCPAQHQSGSSIVSQRLRSSCQLTGEIRYLPEKKA